jgi:diketogulonate reductase-like aldo/keto reductase
MNRVVPITTSQTESRIRGYIAAGDIELTKEEIEIIDKEGKKRDSGLGESLARGAGYLLMCAFLVFLYKHL